MYFGIDIGGTNLKIGVIDEEGGLLYQRAQPTMASKGFDFVKNSLFKMIIAALEKYPDCNGVGIGVPGIISFEGTLKYAPNLPGWKGINIKEIIEYEFQLPVTVDNDANAGAVAELYLGAGKNESHFIYVTLGTGVGGTIIIDGNIYRGKNNGAGEIGHIIIDAFDDSQSENPYRSGILEEHLGRSQITQLARKTMKKYPASLLHKYEKPDPYFITEALNSNDQAAIEVFFKTGTLLGIGLVSAMNLLDIPLIILGGGISQAHSFLFDTALQTIKDRAVPTISQNAELRMSHFQKNAGIIGAALLSKYDLGL